MLGSNPLDDMTESERWAEIIKLIAQLEARAVKAEAELLRMDITRYTLDKGVVYKAEEENGKEVRIKRLVQGNISRSKKYTGR